LEQVSHSLYIKVILVHNDTIRSAPLVTNLFKLLRRHRYGMEEEKESEVMTCTFYVKIMQLFIHSCIYSFRSLSYDTFIASSRASSPHTAIQCFLLQFSVFSSFLKVFQELRTYSPSSSRYFLQ